MRTWRVGPASVVAAVVLGLAILPGSAAAFADQRSTSASSSPSGTVTAVHTCDQTPGAGRFACFAERRIDTGGTRYGGTRQLAGASTSLPRGYGPAQLQSAYGLTYAAAVRGYERRVYVIDAYNSPTAEKDLATYRARYGLPACTTANGCFRKLNQRGARSPLPRTNTGWAGETALDLDMVSAVCPHCRITLMEADDDSLNLLATVQKATALGAHFVSMSWGGRESATDARLDARYFRTAGVVYTASTGDNGYAGGVAYPASSPDVVAVGGTSLTRNYSVARGWRETVWHNYTGGTGSGCSAGEARPAWQGAVTTGVCSRRATADVSAVADPRTGVAVYTTTGGNGWGVYGGTSASAPIVAGAWAMAGAPAPATRPGSLPYARPTGLNDVVLGSTASCGSRLCTAVRGWDGPTGLGTPHGLTAFTDPAA